MRRLRVVKGCILVGFGFLMLVSAMGWFGIGDPSEVGDTSQIISAIALMFIGLIYLTAGQWRNHQQ